MSEYEQFCCGLDVHNDLNSRQKAEVLMEMLPWLQEFAGRRVVIKYGGNAMINDELKKCFAQDMVFLRQVGIYPIVVHGGGPQISAMLQQLGIETEFKEGFRRRNMSRKVLEEILEKMKELGVMITPNETEEY